MKITNKSGSARKDHLIQSVLKAENKQVKDKEMEKCECGREFTRKYRLNVHIRQKHTGQFESYKCQEKGCDKSFLEKGNLLVHHRKHTGFKPYKCSFKDCHKMFAAMGNKRDHERRHIKLRSVMLKINRRSENITNISHSTDALLLYNNIYQILLQTSRLQRVSKEVLQIVSAL